MLDKVKEMLGITGEYQDGTVQDYIDEAKAFIVDAGVKESNITAGLLARGVADLWNYGGAKGEFSGYFKQRVTQLAYK